MAIGIDLGTTNCALAQTTGTSPQTIDIPQLVAPGDVQARPGLPSFLYLARPDELPKNNLNLP